MDTTTTNKPTFRVYDRTTARILGSSRNVSFIEQPSDVIPTPVTSGENSISEKDADNKFNEEDEDNFNDDYQNIKDGVTLLESNQVQR